MTTILPTLNACLNATAAVLLALGMASIRRKQARRHRMFMLAALTASALFLVSYLFYHYQVGSKRFTGEGLARPVYFAILISHTLLAVLNLPLILITLSYALRRKWKKHRRIARFAFPLWLYVSVTGVVVYLMLYHLYG